MARLTLAVSLLFAITLISSCGGMNTPPVTLTAAQVFSPNVGDVWTFQNGYGDVTTVTIEAAPDNAAGTVGHHIILHFQKNADRAYWGLGIPQAEDHFLMLQLPDGTWRGVADIPNFPQSCPWCAGHKLATLNWHPIDGQPIPYQIVPASVTTGQIQKISTGYHWFLLNDVNTTDDITTEGAQDMGLSGWESDFSAEYVDTPAYQGVAAVSHQFEGKCGNRWCDEEKWYFAPNVGLVEIEPLAAPSGASVPDPRVAIKRIR